ncbi:SusC/RagA family TonB-linked outer membrane protein [Niabella beijingensis]|uniref:SusC/RagA family TonB-linked outer membrane protein n=1 Tax=Niabella beijingensis TaxID=2872700 RepID=UPI001CBF6A62|nr:SusC/RagA family TonB-linked outer membrane protein [Niabella beijingensis]MBZ4187280.1 SusC/RagA family TonB-linked outer membrane protein [Niabella beijingensis]
MKIKLLVQCLMAFVFSLASFTAIAQTKTIQGKVLDDKNQPVAGATVEIKGSQTATLSKDDGTFTINVPGDAKTLQVSFIGFVTQDVPITEGELSVVLQPGQQALDEVVVIGYGTARKKDLTGAMVTISEKNFNKGVMTNPDQLIQGKTPGVMVINNTGQPGGATTVRIRGNSSIRASNNPLFVLDGIPLSGNTALPPGRGGFSSDRGNPLNYLNPNDIASMDILKDASATAIYGSRGANGVVLINTKKGKVGQPVISVVASTGISSLRKQPEVLNAAQFREALNFYTPNEAANSDFGSNVNAFKEITRVAPTQNYYADITGGTEHGKYRLSGGYLNQQGIIVGSQMKKYTANFSGNFKFLENRRLGLDFGMFVTQTDQKFAPIDVGVGAEGNIISQALQWNPTQPFRDENGDFTFVSGNQRNPLASLAAYKDLGTNNTILAMIAPSYKITDDLEYKFVYSVTRLTGDRNAMVRGTMINPTASNDQEQAFLGKYSETDQQMTHTLSYNKQVSSDLNINAVAGYEYLDFDYRQSMMYGNGFTYLGLDYFDYLQYSTISTREVTSYRSPSNQLQSLFLRGAFNYLDRYLLTATVRRDGSTKFGANNKYAIFPSVAFAWNINEENFLKNNPNINQLKLRLGWGKTGNQEFPSGASKDRLTFASQSIVQANYGNPDLKWETSATINAGIDFALFNNRIYGSVDYFNKKTTDALFEQTLAQPAPAGRIWVNLDGEIVNKGVEIAITGNIIRKNDWNWDVTGNATFLKNSVSGLVGYYETGALRGQGFSGVLGQRMANGQPLNVWYLAEYAGIDPNTGMSMYRGLDGSISSDNDPSVNKFYAASPNPTTLLGVSTNLTYKKFSLGANMNGAMGHYLFNNTAATSLGISNLSTRNIGTSFFNTSVKESTSNSASPSTRYLEKGNYLKLANVTLSYKVGDIGNVLKNFNISLTGQNLFILTKYTGFDPEVNTDGSTNGIPSLGIEYLPYPPAKTILLGVNFSL